jgi:hypothetical protein
MKSKVVAISLFASASMLGLGYSSMIFADPTCYDVFADIETTNVTDTTQVGEITMQIPGADFYETGTVVGNVTGAGADENGPFLLLSHAVKFSKGNHFVTDGDKAYAIPQPDGCSYLVNETISKIIGGTKFFKDVTSVNIITTGPDDYFGLPVGTVSYCPENNMNKFSLYGEVCFKKSKN